MSSPIWTQCGGKSNLRSLEAAAWRLVEDQSRVATRKLVDSDQEQERLEQLIEGVKPPIPTAPAFTHLHYLLATPFRYPPLRWGSRFRARTDPGVWYGSSSLNTALAEKAYQQLRLLEDTAADIRSEVVFTAFTIGLKSALAVDLTSPPFNAHESQISSPTTYRHSQALGRAMRVDGVRACRYRSARDTARGTNFAVFSPDVFASKIVSDASRENWHCYATRARVEFRSQSFLQARRAGWGRDAFEVEGHLPTMRE